MYDNLGSFPRLYLKWSINSSLGAVRTYPMRQGTARQQQPQQEPRDLVPVEVLRVSLQDTLRGDHEGDTKGDLWACVLFVVFIICFGICAYSFSLIWAGPSTPLGVAGRSLWGLSRLLNCMCAWCSIWMQLSSYCLVFGAEQQLIKVVFFLVLLCYLCC